MVPTLMIQGSEGEVFAPIVKSGNYYRTRPRIVKVVGVTRDEEVDLSVRKAMIGLEVQATFNHESLPTVLEADEVACYLEDLVEVFEEQGNAEAADHLRTLSTDPLDMYLFEAGTFQVL